MGFVPDVTEPADQARSLAAGPFLQPSCLPIAKEISLA